MGLLEQVVQQAMPGGSLHQPLMQAMNTLLTDSQPPQQGGTSQPAAGASAASTGGLGGILDKLQKAGLDDVVKSWVGNGPNKPIDPQQLGNALGKQTVSTTAQQAGMSEQELLGQLAKALPGIVDKLTANGSLPSLQQVANLLKQ